MKKEFNKEQKILLAAKLLENGSLTISQAAEKCGCTIYEFMELLKEHDVSVFNYSASDLESDVKNARGSINKYKK
jgi:predicted HTH domain antitoxin